MRSISAEALLDLCDRGARARHARRALLLLGAAGVDRADAGSIPIGARNRRLIALRERLFGAALASTTACPECNERVELLVSIDDLLAAAPPIDSGSQLTVVAAGHDVTFRLPCTDDFTGLPGDVEVARGELLRRSVVTIDGSQDEGVLAAALPVIAPIVSSAIEAADPGAVIAFELSCPSCAHAWTAFFDIVSFLWHELEQWSRRVLDDVHRLARGYGWSESEILGLSEARRQAYLERLPA